MFAVFLEQCFLIPPDSLNCTSSSQYTSHHACQKALDQTPGTYWATQGQGVGAWIKINFNEEYKLQKIRLKQYNHPSTRPNWAEAFKEMTIEFSNGKRENLGLARDVNLWNVFHVPNDTVNYFKLTARSVYGHINNGFEDIEIYGCRVQKGNKRIANN